MIKLFSYNYLFTKNNKVYFFLLAKLISARLINQKKTDFNSHEEKKFIIRNINIY